MEYTFRLTEQGINKLLTGQTVSYHFGKDIIHITKRQVDDAVPAELPLPGRKYGNGASPSVSPNVPLMPFTGH